MNRTHSDSCSDGCVVGIGASAGGLEALEVFASEALPFSRIMATEKPVRDFHHYIEPPGGLKTLLSITGSPMYDEHSALCGAVFTIVEVSS